MKKRRLVIRTLILFFLCTAVGYTLYANFTKDNTQKAAIGKEAPDFVLVDMNGEKHRLSEYKGQGIFLNFWGTYCKPCEDEMPFINNQYHQYKAAGIEVLAVNVSESKLAVGKFADRHKLDFPILLDKDGQVQTAYGIITLPATFLVDKDGKVIKYHTGQLSENTIKEFMEKIKP